jgi:hypothetical protein
LLTVYGESDYSNGLCSKLAREESKNRKGLWVVNKYQQGNLMRLESWVVWT